ncbi:MAG: hypothetical protein H7122_09140 [Chitinophagaceae bacterium]|nr:hypothetical protein [Chitinophagaceae bacterium]
MKKLIGANFSFKNNFTVQPLGYHLSSVVSLFCPVVLLLTILLSGCNKQQPETQIEEPAVKAESPILNSDDEFLNAYQNNTQSSDSKISEHRGFSVITFLELLQARAATAKYRKFSKAIADGYQDISVVVPNMGFHYMKSGIVDATFEIGKPEILVYNKKHDGSFELVAVEYAVPIDLTPEVAPKGFTGSADVWERNTGFDLWLLHAWVWHFNPDGVFHDTNPQVHVH